MQETILYSPEKREKGELYRKQSIKIGRSKAPDSFVLFLENPLTKRYTEIINSLPPGTYNIPENDFQYLQKFKQHKLAIPFVLRKTGMLNYPYQLSK